MREPILQGAAELPLPRMSSSSPEEDGQLRPQRMRDMVGQREVYARLEIAVDAAQKRGETLGHILFDGPPGLGKTTFATCIPRDLGVSFQIASGAALSAPKDLIPYLTNAEERSVLFIDEIHRLPKPVEEFLYPAMEDFRIDILLGEGVNARTINMPLRPFTLIGATTRAGMISAPLRDRFHLREHLDFYTRGRVGRDRSPQRREAASADRRRSVPRKSPAAAAARRGWRTTACAGFATTSPAKPTAGSISNWPGGAGHAGDRRAWASTARIANTWRRSSAFFTAARWASRRLPIR